MERSRCSHGGLVGQSRPARGLRYPDQSNSAGHAQGRKESWLMTEIFEKGDAITITCGDRIVTGKIDLISKNQVSAVVTYDALLGGHAGMMPVMRYDLGRSAYRS